MTRKPQSHVRILIYQTWAIVVDISPVFSSWMDRVELEMIRNKNALGSVESRLFVDKIRSEEANRVRAFVTRGWGGGGWVLRI